MAGRESEGLITTHFKLEDNGTEWRDLDVTRSSDTIRPLGYFLFQSESYIDLIHY